MADEPEFKPKCIWCNASWSDANVKVMDVYASQGCSTCGYGSSASGTVQISCHSCGKLMYQKDFDGA